MRRKFLEPLFCLAALTASAQTQVDLRTQSRNVDFTGANTTKPFKSGSALPASCLSGELFYLTNAQAGANIYACTATNAWTSQGSLSTFVQSGAGAVPIPVGHKLGEQFVSCGDFGAAGDGTTDDTAACQAAINAVAGSTYGTVLFDNNSINGTAITFPHPIRLLLHNRGVALTSPLTVPNGVYVDADKGISAPQFATAPMVSIKCPATTYGIVSATWSGGVATFATSGPNPFVSGELASMVGMAPAGWNVLAKMTVVSNTTFTVAMPANPGTVMALGTAQWGDCIHVTGATGHGLRGINASMRDGAALYVDNTVWLRVRDSAFSCSNSAGGNGVAVLLDGAIATEISDSVLSTDGSCYAALRVTGLKAGQGQNIGGGLTLNNDVWSALGIVVDTGLLTGNTIWGGVVANENLMENVLQPWLVFSPAAALKVADVTLNHFSYADASTVTLTAAMNGTDTSGTYTVSASSFGLAGHFPAVYRVENELLYCTAGTFGQSAGIITCARGAAGSPETTHATGKPVAPVLYIMHQAPGAGSVTGQDVQHNHTQTAAAPFADFPIYGLQGTDPWSLYSGRSNYYLNNSSTLGGGLSIASVVRNGEFMGTTMAEGQQAMPEVHPLTTLNLTQDLTTVSAPLNGTISTQVVAGVPVTAGGAGYTSATAIGFTITAGSCPMTPTATPVMASGVITGVAIANGGDCTANAALTASAMDNGGGSGAAFGAVTFSPIQAPDGFGNAVLLSCTSSTALNVSAASSPNAAVGDWYYTGVWARPYYSNQNLGQISMFNAAPSVTFTSVGTSSNTTNPGPINDDYFVTGGAWAPMVIPGKVATATGASNIGITLGCQPGAPVYYYRPWAARLRASTMAQQNWSDQDALRIARFALRNQVSNVTTPGAVVTPNGQQFGYQDVMLSHVAAGTMQVGGGLNVAGPLTQNGSPVAIGSAPLKFFTLGAAATSISSTSEQILGGGAGTATLVANELAARGTVSVVAQGSCTANANNKTINIRFGPTGTTSDQLLTALTVSGANSPNWQIHADLQMLNGSTASYAGYLLQGNGTAGSALLSASGSFTPAIASANFATLTVSLANSADACTVSSMVATFGQ